MLITMSSAAQNKQNIKIIQADEGTSHPSFINTHVLTGNVIFEHDSTLMYCDSAYFFLDSNAFHAFSNIRVEKGDSIRLTGDTLYYHGLPKTADMVGSNIVYTDRQFQLVTTKLHYDFNTEIGQYITPGTITNLEDKNTIHSKKGEYHSKSQIVYFKDSVRLKNSEYEMISDTLVYHTTSKTAYFHGPTDIISADNQIYCENGYYDTENEITSIWQCAEISNHEQIITGDSIHYSRNIGIGEIFGNVEMLDTTNHIQLFGDFGYHDEFQDSTSIHGHGQMTQIDDKDTLFLSANYLSIKTDSANTNRKVQAYDSVRIHQTQFQATCDSLVYSDQDSLMKFFTGPVLWSDNNQITGKYIEAEIKKNEIRKLTVNKNAFIISEVDSVMFDQIKGKDLYANFTNGKISKVDVIGNGQTLYHIQNVDSLYLESNSATCAELSIRFTEGAIDRIKFIETPKAIYQSIDKMPSSERYFEDFKWLVEQRPQRKEYIQP